MEDKEDFNNLTIDLYYLNNTIEDYVLPLNLNELRIKVKKLFHIENRENNEIFFLYDFTVEEEDEEENIKKEVTIEVKTDDDYALLLKRIKSHEIKNDIIFIETDKCPGEINRKTPQTFEEEIQSVIKSELKAAGERIKKYLSGQSKCYPSTKSQDQNQCSKCNQVISGKIYRSVIEPEEKNYCEKCSLQYDKPLFIIN